MKSIFKLSIASIAVMFLATGCTYRNSIGVSQVDISKTDMSKISTLKSGEACQSWFLIFPTGFDSTARQAAKNGNISKIVYQEASDTNFILGGSHCIKVYGN
jgi:hypothetical protein